MVAKERLKWPRPQKVKKYLVLIVLIFNCMVNMIPCISVSRQIVAIVTTMPIRASIDLCLPSNILLDARFNPN